MNRFSLERMLGPHGPAIKAAMKAGLSFLDNQSTPELLAQTGQTIARVPLFTAVAKQVLQTSYGGNQPGPSDDFLVGRGLFYLTEQRRLFLDCTSGHYQMLWGYQHPELSAAIEAATRDGIIWDNHSNIPQGPVKQLAHQLVAVANEPGATDPLDTVLLGVCTGSVACAAALKIQLMTREPQPSDPEPPVIVVLEGNYHGTDFLTQHLRGMWPRLQSHIQVAPIPPNDDKALDATFQQYGARIAGFWAEPIMMNREAIVVEAEFLQRARRWCDQVGALMCIDEIQTGFWQPEVFAYRALGVAPDLVIAGKGMTAGFHPLSAVIYKRRHDVLAQYDAISTNGSASLPSYVALCSIAMIQEQKLRIRQIGKRITEGFQGLVAEFPNRLQSAQGSGHLMGLKFKEVAEAIAFHQRALEGGIWCRVHAYHAGHSTVLTKLGLPADETVVDYVVSKFRALLK